MDINDLIATVKKKIEREISIEKIIVEDKTFLHKNHLGFQEGRFHIKIFIESAELKKLSKLDSNKVIYKILDEEMKKFIHSLQISIN